MEKKYIIDNPKLMAEWNYEKNIDIDPSKITLGSDKKVWWKCDKGHEWEATIVNRNRGTNCPYCSNRKILKGYNDLLTINPDLAKEWNYEKNGDLSPENFGENSIAKVWWKCNKGHEWQATVNHRTSGRNCPFCAGQKVLQGINDLQTINPSLAKEWNYEKNNNLVPSDVMPNSNKKIWWKCNTGHEWQATIASRNSGNGCPYCSGRTAIKGINDLQTINPDLAKEWNYEKNGDLSPTEVTIHSNKKVWWKCSKGHEWKIAINNRSNGNGCPYCSGRFAIKNINDLQTINPTLAKEWNYEKNYGLTPIDVLPNSEKKVWWKCNKGHEWQATIASRSGGAGCPTCHSERNTSLPEYALEYYLIKSGFDVIHPYKELGYELDIYIPSKKIAIEYDGSFWHKNKTKKDLEKNAKSKKHGIKLYRIREGLASLNDSSIDYVIQENQKDLQEVLKKIFSEITRIDVDVNLKRDNIEIENLREHTEKENSLLFSNPALAREWNHEKNGKLKPESFSVNSGKKVWWICKKGHEWQATIKDRNNGNECPYCSNKKVMKDYNDLLTLNPSLGKEWNYEKNNGLTSADVFPNSSKKVWWKCGKGHEWQATIASRNKGSGCPYCSGRYAVRGENDLQTVNPSLANEWNYEKNTGLTPMDVLPNSHNKVWWRCVQSHEWQASIKDRNNGRGCPYCSGRKKLDSK